MEVRYIFPCPFWKHITDAAPAACGATFAVLAVLAGATGAGAVMAGAADGAALEAGDAGACGCGTEAVNVRIVPGGSST